MTLPLAISLMNPYLQHNSTSLIVIRSFYVVVIIVLLLTGCQESSSGSPESDAAAEAASTVLDDLDDNADVSQAGPRQEASSEVQTEIAKCAAVEGSLTRLNCYDQLAESLGLTPETTTLSSGPGEGNWRVSIDTNPIDDSRTVVLALTADEVSSTYGEPISLILRCQSNNTEVYINWNSYLGSEADVTTRVGDAPAQTRRWPLSTDSKATFYPGGDISFINSLMESDQFVAQVTPYSESPVTAVFNTAGLEKAVEPLRETCNW